MFRIMLAVVSSVLLVLNKPCLGAIPMVIDAGVGVVGGPAKRPAENAAHNPRPNKMRRVYPAH
jgi:hypothetical protein